jgi:hypothetical protein
MKLNQSVKIGDMVVIKGQKKGYPICDINRPRTHLAIGGFLGTFEVSNLNFVDNESPTFSDSEVKAIAESVTFVWQDPSELQIALDDMGQSFSQIEILSGMYGAIPENMRTCPPMAYRVNEYLATYHHAVETYVIENELYK